MRKYFTTGLAILLPIFITYWIINFFVNLLTKPFLGFTQAFIDQFFPTYADWHPGIVLLLSKVLILCLLTVIVFIIGIIGKMLIAEYIFKCGDKLLHRLPFINRIYKACQDIVQSLFSPSSKTFSQVVFVPFPSPRTLSVGLVTKESISIESLEAHHHVVPVFVPGTPNPSVGFLMMFKREQLIFVNMTIEEALKFVVSCGVALPEFSIQHPPKNL